MEIPKNIDPRTQEILRSHLQERVLVNGETGHLEAPEQTIADLPATQERKKKAFPTFAEKSLPPERD
mgnify:CR=1 FL=1